MTQHRSWDPDCKIYIGGLRDDANRYDLEDVFSKYGPVRDVWVARKPPGFAFIEMEDPRDAKDAVKGLDGARVCGVRWALILIRKCSHAQTSLRIQVFSRLKPVLWIRIRIQELCEIRISNTDPDPNLM